MFLTDTEYAQRLLNCYDSPVLLYYQGEADLNASRIIAIVGTRKNSDYGKRLTENIVEELATQNVLIISGLAFGVDALAHKNALKHDIPTVGVLAHGLDKIYPPEHVGLSNDILDQRRELFTEYRSKLKPDKHNFPMRNRIVAGMSDAVIVVETGCKGGSMITAELANNYNRDVFAFPGRTTDCKSAGCNALIRNNRAMLLNNAPELLEMMNWNDPPAKNTGRKLQRQLFVELSEAEKTIVSILQQKDKVHIDELNQKSGLASSTVAASILNLELQNLILSLPGKLYQLA